MAVTRRTLIKTAAATSIAGGFLGGVFPATLNYAWSKSSIELGQTKIDVLSDGKLSLPVDALLGDISEADLKEFFQKHN